MDSGSPCCAAAHDHTHVLAEDHAATLVTAGKTRAGGARSGRWWRPHRHAHVHHAELPVNRLSADGGVAAGVGMLHGIGIESPTQIAIFVASTSVVGTANGLSLLAAWVIGLVVANVALAVAAGTGLTRPDGNRKVFVALAVVVAVGSIALGISYLLA